MFRFPSRPHPLVWHVVHGFFFRHKDQSYRPTYFLIRARIDPRVIFNFFHKFWWSVIHHAAEIYPAQTSQKKQPLKGKKLAIWKHHCHWWLNQYVSGILGRYMWQVFLPHPIFYQLTYVAVNAVQSIRGCRENWRQLKSGSTEAWWECNGLITCVKKTL